MEEAITWATIKEKYSIEYGLLLEYLKHAEFRNPGNIFAVINDKDPDERLIIFNRLPEPLQAALLTGFMAMPEEHLETELGVNTKNDTVIEIRQMVHAWLNPDITHRNELYERAE